MRRILVASVTIIAWLCGIPAAAQNPGVIVTGPVTPGHVAKFIDKTHIQDGGVVASTLTLNHIFVGAAGNVPADVAMSGDCAIVASGAITCTKTNGATFSTIATSGSATDLIAGTVGAARGGAGAINGALKGNGAGVVSQAACADLSNGATGCSTATGTSGATLSLNNGNNTLSGNNTHTGNDWYGGQPVYSVRTYCATVDGVTDNTACIIAARNAVNATGGILWFDDGHYCVKTAGGVSFTTAGIHLQGPSWGNGLLVDACGVDVAVFTFNADSIEMDHISVHGFEGVTATTSPVNIGPNGVRTRIHDNTITAGLHNIVNNAPDVTIKDNILGGAYGNSQIWNVASGGSSPGCYCWHNEVDQNYPVSVPSFGSLGATAAWSAGATINVGDLRTTAGYVVQARVGGVTAGGAPPLTQYLVDIPDGANVKWRLVGATTFYAYLIDTGSVNVLIQYNDMTGPYTAGVEIANSLAGVAPNSITIQDNTIGSYFTFGIQAASGGTLKTARNLIQNCVSTSCIGIALSTGWTSDAIFTSDTITQVGASGNGVSIASGTLTKVTDITVNGAATAVAVAANINSFAITGLNIVSVTTCVAVAAGTSNDYDIHDNNCGTAAVTDGGTGTRKRVCTITSMCLGTITNDNAAAGFIGEYFETVVLSGSAVALTSSVVANIGQITNLPAGDWDVWGNVCINPNGATTTSFIAGWVSSTSATLPPTFPNPNNGGEVLMSVAFSAGQVQCLPVGTKRFSLSAATTIFLSIDVTFATNTNAAFGAIAARRRR